MDIQLKTKGQVEVYDVITTFAVSAPAVGLQKICRHAQLNENSIDANAIENQFKLSPGASRNLFINGIQSGVWDDTPGTKAFSRVLSSLPFGDLFAPPPSSR